ncbi:hypothetical protein L198_03058 [Cryptococcus wingfieldii CBS 7118]|uniref:ER membrane protein complex subunit 6 n=1 Tax=Cryptococcus wingfieldii CBS 7118 TaxID=1295528 RepID=A0A1E3JLC4_9TREE|nr:hypothetical protein L198_03058 [Cryptococcus wingfieldii CBS 7118]ODO00732.1 hypothetical protein L198_03058 [Cryptococcus wingfieldii CBS 7118]
MNPGAGPFLNAQLSPDFSPLHPQSVIHNTRILGSISTLSACFSGLVAGILGFTNSHGFLLYLISSFVTALIVGTIKCGADLQRFVPGAQPQGKKAVSSAVNTGPSTEDGGLGASLKGWWSLSGIGQENFLGFLLFWIGSYALIHVYD